MNRISIALPIQSLDYYYKLESELNSYELALIIGKGGFDLRIVSNGCSIVGEVYGYQK